MQKLALQWSPEQISGWLKQQFPTDRDMRISHEAIYRSLFVQTRGVLKKELTAQLRTRRQMRHAKGGKAKNGQGHILDMVSIRDRPAEAEDRAVPGHWEGDLLTGASDTHIVTLVERHSRFTMLVKLPRKDTTTVVAALAKHIRKLPEQLQRSLTWTKARRCLATNASRLPPTCRFTSVIRAVHGSVAATRTPTACCDSTSREEPISRASPRPTSMALL